MLLFGQTDPQHCPAFLKTRKGARIVRLAEEVLWIAAEAAPVAIAREDWAQVHARCPGLAAFEDLPRARRRDILNAWLADAPAPAHLSPGLGASAPDGAAVMTLLRETIVACDGLEVADALAAVEGLLAWAAEAPDEPTSGRILSPADRAEVRTLYLDTRPAADWPALARLPRDLARGAGGSWMFAFAGALAFAPQALTAEEKLQAAAVRSEERQLVFSFF
jgi:hypothetical protein